MNNVNMAGYHKPTPVQRATIPYVMHGRDIMGCAQTGSGKTVSNVSLQKFLIFFVVFL